MATGTPSRGGVGLGQGTLGIYVKEGTVGVGYVQEGLGDLAGAHFSALKGGRNLGGGELT
jgi:hypothetical protein